MLLSKSNAQYIRHFIVLYESMVEDAIEQLSIHTYLKRKENKKMRPHAPTFSKTDDKLMNFFRRLVIM